MLVFRSAIADWSDVPTGSMKPTIVEGDRILINKMAYDLRIPFTHHSIYKVSDPEPGDIVVFDSEISKKRLVKRVIGVPGDRLEMRDNLLYLNGERLKYEIVTTSAGETDAMEKLHGKTHQVRFKHDHSLLANFPEVEVPPEHYLVLGDNRDNSADSRVIGFVPRNSIVGRTRQVVVSIDYENYFIPRKGRFLHSL